MRSEGAGSLRSGPSERILRTSSSSRLSPVQSRARPAASALSAEEEAARKEQIKSHRASISTAVPVEAFVMPKRKVLQSETERWIKLSAKVAPFTKGLEEYLQRLFSVVIACECPSLRSSDEYETLVFTVPKEVLALAKARLKAGEVSFKLVAQEKLSAFEMLERCLAIFRWVGAENSAIAATVASKGAIDLAHVTQLQFFYKYFLRILNHWNYAHAGLSNGIPVALQRNFLMTVCDKVGCGILGMVVNEIEFLRQHLQAVDPTGSLASQLTGEDMIFEMRSAELLASSAAREVPGRRRGGPSALSPRAGDAPSSLTGSLGGGGSARIGLKRDLASYDHVPSVAESAPAAAAGGRRHLSPRSISSTSIAQSMQQQQQPASVARMGLGGSTSLPDMGRTVSAAQKLAILQLVYSDEALRTDFVEFAKTKFAEENVHFLVAVVRITEAPLPDRERLYRQLLIDFVDASSTKEVNLSSKARKSLLTAPTEFGDLSCLDLAWKDVEHQVVQNLCGPFLLARDPESLLKMVPEDSVETDDSPPLSPSPSSSSPPNSPTRAAKVASSVWSPLRGRNQVGAKTTSPRGASPLSSPRDEVIIIERKRDSGADFTDRTMATAMEGGLVLSNVTVEGENGRAKILSPGRRSSVKGLFDGLTRASGEAAAGTATATTAAPAASSQPPAPLFSPSPPVLETASAPGSPPPSLPTPSPPPSLPVPPFGGGSLRLKPASATEELQQQARLASSAGLPSSSSGWGVPILSPRSSAGNPSPPPASGGGPRAEPVKLGTGRGPGVFRVNSGGGRAAPFTTVALERRSADGFLLDEDGDELDL